MKIKSKYIKSLIHDRERINAYFYIKYKEIPSTYTLGGILGNCYYHADHILELLKSQGYKELWVHGYEEDKERVMKKSDYLLDRKGIVIQVSISEGSDPNDEWVGCTIIILFRKKKEREADKLYSMLGSCLVPFDNKSSTSITLVAAMGGGFDSIISNIKHVDIALHMNYGEELAGKHDLLVEDMVDNDRHGIVLLHGAPGTGKTYYIKYLSNMLNKSPGIDRVFYLPKNLVGNLDSPQMIQYMMSRTNSVFVIEDAEDLIVNNNGVRSSELSELLNLADGIIGDVLHSTFILTFNVDRKDIDPALYRKGRVLMEHKFDKLSKEKSQVLLDHLGKQYTATESMTLADIYNLSDKEVKLANENGVVGFTHRA